MSDEMQIITPPVADQSNPIDHGLIALVQAIEQMDPDLLSHGCLGGSHGYGADYENDTFLMHPFCWCERDDCPWCDDCDCASGPVRVFVDGAETTTEAAWAFSEQLLGKNPFDMYKHGTPEYEAYSKAWHERIDERNRRTKHLFPSIKHKCAPLGLRADAVGGDSPGPNQAAPNFWHKRTGMKVWWYKWIGREMEIINHDGVDLQAVFRECIASVHTVKS